ncbi:hypothetical protein PF0661 [Pyrococcus furiosus DSM 3638]|uniref:Transcription regulator TrmB N-terminal domain-containing protein n=3 Tax=Pyrococcus furiosus TaxID=2261 RepID=Q8U315_PYRFU|nr:hypothetical protein PF0661 [Pyrococcus furiosus DSM 3638]
MVSCMIDEKLVENLKRLGLKDYEARVYAALVLLGPSKASEVARESGVPRPKVYEVLKELHRKGFVDFSEGKPAFFRAVEPEKVIGVLRDEYIKSAEEAIISLKSGGKQEEEWYPVWYLQGEWNIRRKAEELIDGAQREIMAAFVDRRFSRKLVRALRNACRREVEVTVLLLGGKRPKYLEGVSVELVDPKKLQRKEDLRDIFINSMFEGPYAVKALIIVDSRESLMIYEEKGALKGILVTIPFIPTFQRAALLYLMDETGAEPS